MRGKISKKMKDVSKLMSISKNLNSSDMSFLYDNLTHKSKHSLSELVYNILYNTDCLHLSKAQLLKIKRILLPHRKDFEYIAKQNGSVPKKKEIMKKQIGSGVFTALVSALAPILISLIANSVSK